MTIDLHKREKAEKKRGHPNRKFNLGNITVDGYMVGVLLYIQTLIGC
jgi:hypothetical protein